MFKVLVFLALLAVASAFVGSRMGRGKSRFIIMSISRVTVQLWWSCIEYSWKDGIEWCL